MKNTAADKNAQFENDTKRAWGKPSVTALSTDQTHGGAFPGADENDFFGVVAPS